ncbi:MAG: sugar transferase, partial [Muribaculaceae bacterium]|nr:sugar transferase [Muribaculaceae bacterium]
LFYRSRLDDFINTLGTTFVGMLLVYFTALLNDSITDRMVSYELMAVLWGCLFIPVYAVRLVIATSNIRRRQREGNGWRTLIIGVTPSAVKEARRIEAAKMMDGMTVCGFIDPRREHVEEGTELEGVPVYGFGTDFTELKRQQAIDAIVIMPHPSGMNSTLEVINKLYPLDLPMLIPPGLHNLITMRPRMTTVSTEPLVDITNAHVPPRLANMKRASDILISAVGLVALSPLLAAIAIAVKLDSKGPAIFRQERVGYHKKPFRILKFRTMHTGAEENGPALSSTDDPRVTRIGKTLRKYRLDELLQLWNVLVGEMSLVGPRPERDYYVQQILKKVPAYSLIHQVRPGITSWGMVRYGYATTVDEMIERLRYDLLYIENVSLGVDLKILYHTIDTVLSGRGM